MNQRTLLKKTMDLARTGDADAFQNFYILTVQDTYGKICSLVKEREQAEPVLEEVYLRLYKKADTLPVDVEELTDRIEEEIYRVVEKELGHEPAHLEFEGEYPSLKEERAVTMWLKIEEKAGLTREEPEEDKGSFAAYLYSLMKVVMTVVVLIFTVAVFYLGLRWFRGSRKGEEIPAIALETAAQSSEAPIVIEGERLPPGWEQKPDGKLYYTTKEGRPADGPVAIGKQILTFSRNGELTMIGSNKDVVENMNLSFDEKTRYEVKAGDIYIKAPDSEEETRAVMNGHVVQADVRCGYLWYISQYQIPNSSQVKTTLYRAEPDGGRQEEIYTTDSTLESGSFQVTSRWLYYLSDGTLYRKELSTGNTEFLATDVEHYFAWEDTAYYMKDRTLESVSQGVEYSGTEAGYRIELREQGLVLSLFDASGNPVAEEGSGEVRAGDRFYRLEEGVIKAVSPAPRRDGDVTYYIDDAGTDKKIYWKDGAGTRGLIRQEGLVADSFCIAGDWLYYSARTDQYGAECDSQIYRLNLQTMTLEKSGAPFRGYMRNLYYFDNVQAIFGEYIPSVADPEDIHGEIAVISLGGGIEPVNDTGVRPETDGSDMLEMVMAEGDRIYCLYHRLSYDSDSGQMAWETTKPLEIGLNGTEIQNGAEDE